MASPRAGDAVDDGFAASSSALRDALRQRTVVGAPAGAEAAPAAGAEADGVASARNGRTQVPLLDFSRLHAVAAAGPLARGSFGGAGRPMPATERGRATGSRSMSSESLLLTGRRAPPTAAISAWAAKKDDPPLIPRRPKTLSEKSRSDAPSASAARGILAYGSTVPHYAQSPRPGVAAAAARSSESDSKSPPRDGAPGADAEPLAPRGAGVPAELLTARVEAPRPGAGTSRPRRADPSRMYGALGKSAAMVAAEAEEAARMAAPADGSETAAGESAAEAAGARSRQADDNPHAVTVKAARRLTGRVAAAAAADEAAGAGVSRAPSRQSNGRQPALRHRAVLRGTSAP